MNLRIICFLLFSLGFAVSLGDSVDSCPDFTATFVVVMEQNISFVRLINDREQTFFKYDMGLRDDEIEHVFEDAL